MPIQTGSYKSKFGEKGTLPGTRTGMAISVFRKHSPLKESFVWRTLNIMDLTLDPHLLARRLLLGVKLMLPAQGRGVHWRRGRRNHLRQTEKTVKIASTTQ